MPLESRFSSIYTRMRNIHTMINTLFVTNDACFDVSRGLEFTMGYMEF